MEEEKAKLVFQARFGFGLKFTAVFDTNKLPHQRTRTTLHVEHHVQTMVWPKMGRRERESTSRVRPGRRLDCSSTMSESINIGMIKSGQHCV